VRWVLVAALALQAHFAASYLVPLDRQAQAEFGGLLRWVWPWAHGDRGPLGRITETGFPLPGFFLAVTAAAALLAAALAVAGWWVPAGWWRPLAIAGASLLLVLTALFLSPTKVLPILFALVTLYVAIMAPAVAAPR